MDDQTLDLFAPEPPVPPRQPPAGPLDLPVYRQQLAALAARGLYVGTSSWKYPGWCGLIYDESRYQFRGKLAEKRFNDTCLAEYAETYHTTCFDGGYYQFPKHDFLAGMLNQVPDGFRMAFKVTDEITIKRFPVIERLRERGGMINPNFLNAEMFNRLFLDPCTPFRSKIGPLIFEFSQFDKKQIEHGRDFVQMLDTFLGALPKGWQYGVEIRNKGWLVPEYFAMLKSHNVAHVYNNWTRMPGIDEQMAIEGSLTADFTVARFLLKPGRAYQQAVDMFQPYEEMQERVDAARGAAAKLLESSFFLKRLIYIYVNNRLEGSAPFTIKGFLDLLRIMGELMKQEGAA
jgi:uncharacterized protein YecE (DUF72 family)